MNSKNAPHLAIDWDEGEQKFNETIDRGTTNQLNLPRSIFHEVDCLGTKSILRGLLLQKPHV